MRVIGCAFIYTLRYNFTYYFFMNFFCRQEIRLSSLTRYRSASSQNVKLGVCRCFLRLEQPTWLAGWNARAQLLTSSWHIFACLFCSEVVETAECTISFIDQKSASLISEMLGAFSVVDWIFRTARPLFIPPCTAKNCHFLLLQLTVLLSFYMFSHSTVKWIMA